MCPSTAADTACAWHTPGWLRRDGLRGPVFDGDADRPDEAQELAADGGHDLLLVLAPTEEGPVAAM